MLSGQGDPPIASIKGIRWVHIGVLTQQARHLRGANYFYFLCSRLSSTLRCKLSFRPIQHRNTLNLPHIRSWPLLVRVWTEQTPLCDIQLFSFTYLRFSMYLLLYFYDDQREIFKKMSQIFDAAIQFLVASRNVTLGNCFGLLEACFSKVPKLFGSISDASISFISSQRRGSEPANFAILLFFLTSKTC